MILKASGNFRVVFGYLSRHFAIFGKFLLVFKGLACFKILDKFRTLVEAFGAIYRSFPVLFRYF